MWKPFGFKITVGGALSLDGKSYHSFMFKQHEKVVISKILPKTKGDLEEAVSEGLIVFHFYKSKNAVEIIFNTINHRQKISISGIMKEIEETFSEDTIYILNQALKGKKSSHKKSFAELEIKKISK